MIGYIYLITDTTNGKQYVGQHHYNREELDPNYHGSGNIIRRIFEKRPSTIKEGYLKTCYTQRELDEWEKYFIILYNTLSPNGYNLQEGGRGGTPSENTKKRMSEVHKGGTSGMKGKKVSDETKKRMSESHKGLCAGEKHPMFGKHHKEESRKKVSKTVLQYTLDGDFICEWISSHEVERVLGYSRANISKCCSGKLKSTYGFIWKYKKEAV